ncbi:MAG: NAD(+) diphosphatase [Synergistales bacterium]|nr:NAD(+) diphosphatase [Synergistales bacterium]
MLSFKNGHSPTWYIFREEEILVFNESNDIVLPRLPSPDMLGLDPIRTKVMGFPDRSAIHWAEVNAGTEPPAGMEFTSRRHLLDVLGEEDFTPAGMAYHYMDWTRKTQFCGKCGNAMEDSPHERARLCPRCGHTVYPVISPAIIVAVEREGKILLGRSPRFPKGRYSVLAGFVEPGESLEEAVRREILEEVAVEVDQIAYFGSQPWPFPHSIMLGFTAKWKSGEIMIDENEIEDAGWYAHDEIPNTPSTRSISGKLIRHFIENSTGKMKDL